MITFFICCFRFGGRTSSKMQRPCRTENEKCRLQISRFTNHAICMEATCAAEEEQHDGRAVSALDATVQRSASRVRLCADCKQRKPNRRFSSGHGPLAREPLSKGSTRGCRYREGRTEHITWVCHAVPKASTRSTLPIQLPEPALPMTRRIAVNSLDSREGSSTLLQRSQSGRTYVCGHSPVSAAWTTSRLAI
jgi:hypothetical protein